jgi:hypothetical protein
MPLSTKVLAARIDLRVAELRLLAAWTAVAVPNRNDPPPALCMDVGSLLAVTAEPAIQPPRATPQPK